MVTLTPEQVEDAARVMPDHVLATSFMAPEARARVIALILFAHEIGRARAVVSEAGLAAIRLQWWRDVIDHIYTGKVTRAQPAAIALVSVISEAKLPRTLFDAMIDAHERELETEPFAAWTDLEDYLDQTFGNLNRLSLLASGLSAISTSSDTLARKVGIAWGLSQLIRTMPQWSQRRSMWLPVQASATIDLESVFAGHVASPLRDVLFQAQARIMAAHRQANIALKSARLDSHFPAMAHACLAQRYGKAAVPALGSTWAIAPDISLLERQIRITWSVARGRI